MKAHIIHGSMAALLFSLLLISCASKKPPEATRAAPEGARPCPCTQGRAAPEASLHPKDPDRALTIRVVRVVNPRFPKLTTEEIGRALEITREVLRDRFGLKVRFDLRDGADIGRFFAAYLPRVKTLRDLDSYRFHLGEDPTSKLVDALMKEYEGTPPEELKGFLKGYIPDDVIQSAADLRSLMEAVAELHIEKLKELYALKLPDGEPLLLKGGIFNEYVYWEAIAQTVQSFDLILTNQLIASAEVVDSSIHSAIRGGITTGVTVKSPGPYKGVIVYSSAPFLLDNPFFDKARGGSYSREEIIRTYGWYLVHEFGHLLLHRGHHYDHTGCVMKPARDLDYRAWTDEMASHPACPLPHPTEMMEKYLGFRK